MPSLADLLGFGTPDQPVPLPLAARMSLTGPVRVGGPVYQNLPQNIGALQRLRETVAGGQQFEDGSVREYSPELQATLDQINRQRIARGQPPMSSEEAFTVLGVGETLDAYNPVPEQGSGITDLPANAVKDLRDLFVSIPKLPFMLAGEAKRAAHLPQLLSEVAAQPGFGEKAKAASQLPILNLVPGVYTAGNILSGDFDEIMKHPVMTTLDVLPYAKAKVFPAATKAQLAKRSPHLELGSPLTPEETAMVPVLQKQIIDDAAAVGRTPDPAELRLTKPALREALYELTGERPRQTVGQYLANTTPLGPWKDDLAMRMRGNIAGRGIRTIVGKDSKQGAQSSSFLQARIDDRKNVLSSPRWRPGGQYYEAARQGGTLESAIKMFNDAQAKYLDPDAVRAQGWDPLEWQKRREQLGEASVLTDDIDALKASLPDYEREFLDDTEAIHDATIAPYTADHAFDADPSHSFARVRFDGGARTEIYPLDQAKQIETIRDRLNTARQQHLAATANGLDEGAHLYSDEFRDFLMNERVSQGLREDVLVGHLFALANQGKDTLPLVRGLRQGTLKVRQFAQFDDIIRDMSAPGFSAEELQAMAKGRVTEPTSRKFIGHLRDGQWSKALKEYNDYILGRYDRVQALPKVMRDLDPETLRVSLRREAYRDRSTKRLRGHEDTKLIESLEARVARTEDSLAPARLFPRIEQAAAKKMEAFTRALSERLGHDPELARQLAEHARSGQRAMIDPHYKKFVLSGANKTGLRDPLTGTELFPEAFDPTLSASQLPPSIDNLFDGFADEAAKSWKDLGNPQFLHAYGPDAQLNYVQRVAPSPYKPSQDRARTHDFRSWGKDPILAIDQMQTERMHLQARDELVRIFLGGDPDLAKSSSVATRAELDQMFRAHAMKIAKRSGRDVEEIVENLIRKQFTEFDPSKYTAFGQRQISRAAGDLYIDKALAHTLEELMKPPRFHQFLDPVMGVFRTSVLTLSPRWQIYNLLGNSLTMLADRGVSPLRYLKDATQVIRYMQNSDGTMLAPEAMKIISESFQHSLNQYGREMTENMYRTGKGLAEALGEDNAARALNAAKVPRKGLQMLTKANGMVDNAFRIMTYMDEYNKTFTRVGDLAQDIEKITGDSKRATQIRAARAAGEEAVRRFMYSWDDMTPAERNVMRMIFPFYGFMSHMMRFAYRFAVDHPVRLAVTAGFARAELEDWESGLPQRLRSMGIPALTKDSYVPGTEVKAINMAGWNPFADIGNMMTLTGWLSQANPLISTIAEQFGIDPRTGQANLYPTSAYDPETGRLKLQTRNPAVALLENLIPQSQVITSALGLNPDMEKLKFTNPEAASRLQLTSFGIPILSRDVNLSEEAMVAESARRNAYRQSLTAMLKSPGTPTKYPALEAYRQQILRLQGSNPQALGIFTPAGVFDPREGTIAPLPNAPEVTSPSSPYRQALSQQTALAGTPANPQGGP